jgi:hypothetical protein
MRRRGLLKLTTRIPKVKAFLAAQVEKAKIDGLRRRCLADAGIYRAAFDERYRLRAWASAWRSTRRSGSAADIIKRR